MNSKFVFSGEVYSASTVSLIHVLFGINHGVLDGVTLPPSKRLNWIIGNPGCDGLFHVTAGVEELREGGWHCLLGMGFNFLFDTSAGRGAYYEVTQTGGGKLTLSEIETVVRRFLVLNLKT